MNNSYDFLFNVLIESMFKVPVNNFSHVWTPHKERERERERGRERERERESEKREWGRLNFVPRSNPHPNLHEVKQFLSCQQPITIFVRINMTHFMRGSRNFRQGGPGQSDKKQL